MKQVWKRRKTLKSSIAVFGMYKMAYRNTQNKKPFSQIRQSTVFMGKQKVICQTGHVAGLEPSGVLKVQTYTQKRKKSHKARGCSQV